MLVKKKSFKLVTIMDLNERIYALMLTKTAVI